MAYSALPEVPQDSDWHAATDLRGGLPQRRDGPPKEKVFELFLMRLPRLSITVAINALFIMTLKVYQDKGNLENKDKRVFNVVTTALNIALSLNLLEGFKDMAKVLRWKVLATRASTVREADLILGGENLTELIKLMWESLKKPRIVLACAFWVALNLLAQASVATLSLNYSMDGGTNSSGIVARAGNVSVPMLDSYYYHDVNQIGAQPAGPGYPEEINQGQAHAYGVNTRSQKRCLYSTDDDIIASNQSCIYFYNRNGRDFAFRYSEYDPQDTARSYPYLTDRIVKASTGDCHQYAVSSSYLRDSNDGLQAEFVWSFNNDTYDGVLPIPKASQAFDSTTYVYNGTDLPQNTTTEACGPRCLWVYAFQDTGPLREMKPPELYQCPITITDVSNVTNDAQMLSDDNARIAAASITLTGRYTNPNRSEEKHWEQHRLYPFGSYWNPSQPPKEGMGGLMAEFAIGSLASMANLNPETLIPGTLPRLGYSLSVEWKYVIALVASITAAHCIIVGLLIWISRGVVVIEDSHLVTAKLLQGLIKRLGGRDVSMDPKKIARAVQNDCGNVVYSDHEQTMRTFLEWEGMRLRKR